LDERIFKLICKKNIRKSIFDKSWSERFPEQVSLKLLGNIGDVFYSLHYRYKDIKFIEEYSIYECTITGIFKHCESEITDTAYYYTYKRLNKSDISNLALLEGECFIYERDFKDFFFCTLEDAQSQLNEQSPYY